VTNVWAQKKCVQGSQGSKIRERAEYRYVTQSDWIHVSFMDRKQNGKRTYVVGADINLGVGW